MRKANLWKKYILLIVVLALVFGNANYSLAYPMTFNDEDTYIKTIIKNNYLYEVDNNVLKGNNFKNIFKELDDYSQYYTKAELSKILEGFNNEVVGIGIYIQKDKNNQIYVNKIIDNSPSDGKLKTGDIIDEVDNKKIKELSLEEVADLIKGKAGTMVKLRLKNVDTDTFSIQNIKREKIIIDPLDYKVIENKIGYIQISLFSKDVSKNFEKGLKHFEDKNINKAIIDLRGNGGGYLDETIKMCEKLISNTSIVYIKNKDYEKTYYSFSEKNRFKKENLIILVDENTASASEILAAAIKDTNSGILVGKPTYGKGTVQKLYALPSGAGFKLTEAMYLSPNRHIIEGKGVKPDHEVDLLSDKDEQLKLAIKLLNN